MVLGLTNPLDLVDDRPEAEHARDVDDEADRILQRRALRLGDQLHVEEGLADAGLATDNEIVARWINAAMPAMNKKSPARVARPQVPVGLMAPAGASVLTPVVSASWATAGLPSIPTTAMGITARFSMLVLLSAVEQWPCDVGRAVTVAPVRSV
jgi:hypothetical protein